MILYKRSNICIALEKLYKRSHSNIYTKKTSQHFLKTYNQHSIQFDVSEHFSWYFAKGVHRNTSMGVVWLMPTLTNHNK